MKAVRPNCLLQNSPSTRRGAVVLFAIIALLLTSIIGGSLLKTALAQRRLALREQIRLQSIWLAESGVERATAKLSRDANYTGETWSVSASDIGGNKEAKVIIEVETMNEAANRRRVTVIADYPHNSPQRSRTRKVITIDLVRT
ncbi:MAG: pilus assembly PilX N-terminal domain-containing protein [Planctomycetes bacterium]|nr:pilus assembly PilX N-terminal domain-containing protein [Planctomycetota bacterium]